MLANVLKVVFSTFPVQQRLHAIQPFLQRWNVRVPQRIDSVALEDYFSDMIQRLSLKINRVMERKGQVLGGKPCDFASTWGTNRMSNTSGGVGKAEAEVGLPTVAPVRRSVVFLENPMDATSMREKSGTETSRGSKSLQSTGSQVW
ncbi:hypothetical protein DQ04_05881060 [Trypanosoma grayi]|uniref:hypothetical protein n=1 Tax=Trypanosoma grayi TaxID=71804 RepID=UPI0004F3EF51|nr:hypothetical protein DQ04_05881060 [Trypanosoma grayi]KEG09073.1 hypothetical protein DQ04_05881060 [Trypanosoma grayi]